MQKTLMIIKKNLEKIIYMEKNNKNEDYIVQIDFEKIKDNNIEM